MMTILKILSVLSLATVAAAAEGVNWHWEGAVQSLQSVQIDLIRGEVRIERADIETAEIDAVVSDDTAGLRLEAQQTPQGLKIRDLYPQSSGRRWMRECLPPIDARGDFWHSDARVHMVVRVPRGIPVKLSIAENPDLASEPRQNP